MKIRGLRLFLVFFLLCFSMTASADLFGDRGRSRSESQPKFGGGNAVRPANPRPDFGGGNTVKPLPRPAFGGGNFGGGNTVMPVAPRPDFGGGNIVKPLPRPAFGGGNFGGGNSIGKSEPRPAFGGNRVGPTDWSDSGGSTIPSIGSDPVGVASNATQSSGLAPPASDISVIFLGNLFGLVDGVLHGSGSQIMGVIFNVFNSAVLALGGIVMMYIIIVSTMNTAHEGQMLGQKWSSIWVPVRATMGLALLIPKSSGYCLMQIFVMWVVVQGVGIADKVWGTALDYLNRGGVIMQAQVDPTIARQAGIMNGNKDNSVIDGASTILYGQVCMLALQTQLENQRKRDLDAKKEDAGPCAGQPSALMKQYCDNSVPDFIGSVDPLAEYSKNSGETYSVQMPNLDSEPYSKLNGICGTLKWDSFDVSSIEDVLEDAQGSSNDAQNEEEEEEESVSAQAEMISRAMQTSKAQLDAAGPLQARATTSDSPVGKQYAFIKGAVDTVDKGVKKGTDTVDKGVKKGTDAVEKGADTVKDGTVDAVKDPAGAYNDAVEIGRDIDQATTGGLIESTGDAYKDKAINNYNNAKDDLEGAYNKTKEELEGAYNTVEDGVQQGLKFLDANCGPLMAGGGAVAGGMVAGPGGAVAGYVAGSEAAKAACGNGGFGKDGSYGGGLEGGGFAAPEISGGNIIWQTSGGDSGTQTITLSQGDLDIIKKSRAAAIAQMYITLASTARAIVSNDPEITSNSGNPANYASPVADYQFGVPQTSLNGKCLTMNADCPYWGKVDGSSAPLLLDGTELQDAVTDYHSVMQPALKLLSDVQNKSKAASGRKFIQEAKRSGWVLAGSYFFNIVMLNGSATATSDNVDANSGLGKSEFNLDGLSTICSGNYTFLCDVFGASEEKTRQIRELFTGPSGVSVPKSDLSSNDLDRIPNEDTIIKPEAASTVYGYANNAMLIDLPGQMGLKPNNLAIKLENLKIKMNIDKVTLKRDSDCGAYIPLPGYKWCIERDFMKMFWTIIREVTNGLITALNETIEFVINKILVLPLEHFSIIFTETMKVITTPGTNPVLALAVMGVKYINMSMDTWMSMVMFTLAVSWVPGLGPFIMMVIPLFAVWMGIMVGIGFTTAYYIPFLPYMIFTFGALAWFIAVVEAMAAAPLVALGISHPEGHDAMGKSEQGLMILLNVFLRPAMMVIGFIASIAMCYIGVWLLNSGFSTVLEYLQSSNVWAGTEQWGVDTSSTIPRFSLGVPWANLFGFFFVIVIYTMIYLTLVEKSFSLIAVLPDKVLRWVGGQQENVGEQASQWTQDTKGKVEKGAEGTDRAMGAMQKTMQGGVQGAADWGKNKVKSWLPGGSTKAEGDKK